MALTLFKDRFTEAFDGHGFYTYDAFLEFGMVLGIKESGVEKKGIEAFNGNTGLGPYRVPYALKHMHQVYYIRKLDASFYIPHFT